MRAISLAISLLALSQGAVEASTSSHFSTVNKAGGWGAVDASLEAGHFEPHHAHTWAPMAAAAAAPTAANKAGTTPTPTVQHFTYDPYDLEAGPSEWAKNFPTSQCAGTSQSPVQLPNYANAKADSLLKPLAPSYQIPATTTLSLRNTGHALQINMPTGLSLSGGALGTNPYSVVQMHMHARSEHSVAGGHYPLEIHIVHMDPARDAATDPRALAVLGVMVAESPDNIANPALTPLVSLLPNFTTPLNNFNASAVLKQAFSLTNLLPANMDYYHYNGSLTTPPCSEQVVWHVLTTPIHASRAQILALTAPFGTVGNSRPTQPLNGRSVAVTSFYTPTPTLLTSTPTSSAFGADGALQGTSNTPTATGATTNKINLPLIIGASAGGVVLILLVVGLVMYRRRQTSTQVVARV